ncbi:Hypothetical protein GbCGDNIH6_1629d [Granulibacter bethesdensis]|nr:Hypothetical protein GbCGDNIH6_1629d [Granulibacter bethesdensis]
MSASIRSHLLGLSPRTRRNRRYGRHFPATPRSISAHAEEPHFLGDPLCDARVYLRARGGTADWQHLRCFLAGLSPRTRRNLQGWTPQRNQVGSISAHAEEPRRNARSPIDHRVYLRARGGTQRNGTRDQAAEGLSPRTRRNPGCRVPRPE